MGCGVQGPVLAMKIYKYFVVISLFTLEKGAVKKFVVKYSPNSNDITGPNYSNNLMHELRGKFSPNL